MTLNGISRFVVAAELPVLVATAPLLLFPTPRRLLVLLVVPLIWTCARIATGRFVPRSPLNVALALLLATVGLSLWATFDPVFSLGKVSGVILGALLYWAVVRWTSTRAKLTLGIAAFACAGASLAVIGLLGTQWTEKFQMFKPVIAMLPRVIRGVPGADDGFNPNAVAGCLVLFLPLQAALACARAPHPLYPDLESRWVRRALGTGQLALLLLTSGTVLLLQSRGAWLGLAVAAIAFLLWHGRTTRLLAFAGAVAAAVFLRPDSLSRMVVSGSPSGVGGIADRVEIWSRALYGIQDFAFTGMGMNTFRKVMPVLYPTSLIPPTMDVAHAHNQFLVTALDLGLPGLVAYAAICLLTGLLMVAAYRSTRDRATRILAGGFGAGLVAHLVFGVTDAIPLGAKVGVVFWLTLGLTTALHHIASAAEGGRGAGGPVGAR